MSPYTFRSTSSRFRRQRSSFLDALTCPFVLSMLMLTCRSTTLRRDSYHAYFDRTFDARRCFSPAPAPRAHDGTLRGRSLFAVPPSRRRVQSSAALPALGYPGGERAVPTRSTLNKGAHSTARVWRIIDGLLSTMVVAARSTLNKGAHSTARTCDAYQTFSRLQNVSTSVARQPPAAYRSSDDASSISISPCSRCCRLATDPPDPHAATSVGAVGRA